MKTAVPGEVWKEVNDNYAWQYLHPNGNGKKFPLKSLSCIFDFAGPIDIASLLKDIAE